MMGPCTEEKRSEVRWQGREKERGSGGNSGEVVQGGSTGQGGEEGKTSASRELGEGSEMAG